MAATFFGLSAGGTRLIFAVRDVIFLVQGFLDVPDCLGDGFLGFLDFDLLTIVIFHICNRSKSSG